MADTVTSPDETSAVASTEAPAPQESAPGEQPTAPVTEESTPPATDEPAPAVEAPTAPVEEAPVAETESTDTESTDAGTTDDTARTVAPQVAEQQVAVDVPGTATLTVKKLGKRFSANGGATVLPGATFYAIPGVRGTTPSINSTSEYTCTTTNSGICDINVPAVSGGKGTSAEHGYWIVEGASPAGYSRIEKIGTGAHDGPKAATTYNFFTGNVASGANVKVTADTTSYTNGTKGDATATAEEDGVVNVANNPGFPEACGMNVAVVFDISNSIHAADMTKMKNAANAFVGDEGLANTPSSVSIFAFNTTAGQLLGSTPILEAPGQTVVQDTIAALPADGSGFTNWDDAFRKVAFNADQYDVVLFLTDGDPTTYGSGSDIETNVSFRNVEEGVLSANAVKANGAKVIGVGIGLQPNSYLNLKAISGPAEGDDYYLSDFDGLAAKLHDIAVANCGNTLTIVKETQDAQGKVIDATADGWTFTGSTTGNSIVGPGGATNTLSLTTGAVDPGSATFQLDFTGSSSRAINITEQQQAGFQPVSVECTDNVDPTGPAGNFTVDIPTDGIVACKVVNKQVLVPVDDVGITKTASGLPPQGSVEPGDSFDYVLTVTNNGTARRGRARDRLRPQRSPRDHRSHRRSRPRLATRPPGYVGNVVDLTIDALGVGESATITVSVTFLAPERSWSTGSCPMVAGDEAPPAAPPVLNNLTNTACVERARHRRPNGGNNCASVEIPVRDITAIVYTRCVGDAPLLGWTVAKSDTLTDEPIDFLWTPIAGQPGTAPAKVAMTQPGGTRRPGAMRSTGWARRSRPSGCQHRLPGLASDRSSRTTRPGRRNYYMPGRPTS